MNPLLATRIRNSASGIRTMHSPGPHVQEVAQRHGTSGRSTSCASHHAYPICTPKLGRVIHVDGCTTHSLPIGKALSHSPTSTSTQTYFFLTPQHIDHSIELSHCFDCISSANIDATLYQRLTNINETTNMLCRRTILVILFFVLQACADIVLDKVQPVCNHLLPEPNQGCLRDQRCLPDNS